MRKILLLGLLGALAALVALAQVGVGGGAGPGGAGGALLHGPAAPSNSYGSDGAFYLNTGTSCLYGPKASGVWPASCVSLIGPPGPSGTSFGYTPENSTAKGTPGGYAPLDYSARVPLTNIPVIPYSQTNGLQPALGFTPLSPSNNLGDLSNPAAARSNLGLTIGTNVQRYSGLLDGLAALRTDGMVVLSGGAASSGTFQGDVTTSGLTATVNSVGGSTAANVHSAEVLANGATPSNTNSSIVKRDGLGSINVTQVYAGGTAVENTLNKARANGYPSLDASGLIPVAQIPYTALPSVGTAGDVNPSGNVNAGGVVTAGAGSAAPACYHFTDSNQAHDTVLCAPASGFNGTLYLPAANATQLGQPIISGSSGQLQFGARPNNTLGAINTSTISNTETAVLSAVLPANYLVNGSVLRFTAYCIATTPSASQGNDIFQIRFGPNGNNTDPVIATQTVTMNANISNKPFELYALVNMVTGTGVTSTIKMQEMSATTGPWSTSALYYYGQFAPVTITPGQQNTIQLTVQTGIATSSVTCGTGVLESLRQ